MPDRILVVAAHADDETIGCGGAIHRHASSGDRVGAICFTDGVGAREDAGRAAVRRREAAESAASRLGFEWIAAREFPDNELDSLPLLRLVKYVESIKASFDPKIVYTHHPGDLNVDHRVVFRATLTAFRPQPGERLGELRCFEVASSTEWNAPECEKPFAPNLWIDISGHWEAKVEALTEYDEEMRRPPHPRSVESLDALSRWRGAQAGLDRAEAYHVIRRIERD